MSDSQTSEFRVLMLRAAVLVALITAAGFVAGIAGPAHSAPRPDNVDASVRPDDAFYRFANGPWLAATTLPAGRSSYGTTAMLREENARRVRQIVQEAASARGGSGDLRKIGDYYASWMDTAAIEARGAAPLAPELAAISAIGDRHALSAYLGHTLRPDDGTNSRTDGVLGAWNHQSFHDPDHYVPHLMQSGLGLADRDDYLGAAPEQAQHRRLYQAHVAAVLRLAGFSQPEVRAERVLALEVALARSHAPDSDAADVFTTDNGWGRGDFEAKAPGLDWAAYFRAAGLAAQTTFVVWQPSAVTGVSALAASEPLETWKDYLAFHYVDQHAQVLPKAFRDETLAFTGALAGAPQPAPDRVQQAVTATEAALPQAVGKAYVERWFPPRAKAAAVEMGENLRTAFSARIGHLAWMSPVTRDKALAKTAALKIGLGYPDRWPDYSGLKVVRGDAFGDLDRAEAFAWRSSLAKLGRRVDPREWEIMRPQMVSANIYFSPNAEQFTAGLLQPPYFDPGGDAASNYGSAGAGMGHELGHSFDELGNIYDDQGRLGLWWTPEDLARYRAATARVAAQFDGYCPRPSLCLNGKQVMSESVGDLVGLQIAHDAYQLSLKGRPDVIKDGLTGEQRFFLAYARRWRMLQTEAALRQQVRTDTHPPGEYRADTVRNLDAWYAAFDVKPGDRLYLAPEARVRVW